MKGALVVLAVLCTAAGAAAQQKEDPGIAKVRAAYQTAASSQDGPAIAKLFAADGVEMPPNAPAAKGRAAIEAYHKSFVQQWMVHGMTITAGESKVTGDTAYEVGSYKQSLMAQKGGGMVEDKGKYVVLLKKEGSGWVITHAIYNSDMPPPGAAPAKK